MKARTTKPEAGNKFYITKSRGGYSECIQGKPTDACNVLANCVGYACGRFNEIIGSMKYPTFNCNAENFIERAKSLGLKIVNYPTLGGIMVWQKGATLNGNDGAGHVAIVERIDNANQIYTSESGYNSSAFWNTLRNNNNGRWGQGSAYKFIGCIINPTIGDVHYVAPTPAPKLNLKYKVGDVMLFTGRLYEKANGTGPGATRTNLKCTITKVYNEPGTTKPYNINNGLGWVAESDLKPYTNNTNSTTGLKVGDKVKIIGTGNGSADGDKNTAGGIGWERYVLKIYSGKPYPYQVGSNGVTVGFYKSSALEKK